MVGAMLAVDHRDRRQLRHLVAPEPLTGNLLLLGELAPATTAGLRIVIDDLIHPILRQQPATRALMSRLGALLALCLDFESRLSFSRASARHSARDLGESCDGGQDKLRESRRDSSSNRPIRSCS
jgi:hypothetical protein